MSAQDNGGPAFPFAGSDGHIYNDQGMTLRDYMAAHIDMTDVSFSALEALAGDFPAYATEAQKQDWYARAEATYRYHRADAMLKARQS